MEIFADVSVMQRFPHGLTEEAYQTLEKEGTTAFKYSRCYDTGFMYEKDEEGHSRLSANIILRDDVKIADELLETLHDFVSARSYFERYQEYVEYDEKKYMEDKKKFEDASERLSTFFTTHKDMKNLNILYKPVNVFLKNNAWYCEKEVDAGNLDSLFSNYREDMLWLYPTYKTRLKRLLDRHSFTMLALFVQDLDIPEEDVANLNNYCAANYVNPPHYSPYLLETLIEKGSYKAIGRYKKILAANYTKNPFALISSYKGPALLREAGFEFLRYDENISDSSMEHNDDNLYLAIKYRLHVSDEELWELVDNIPNQQNIPAYLDQTLHSNNETAFRFLLIRYPTILNSKEAVSKYLLHIAKNTTDDDIVEFYMEAYPYETYDAVIDPSTGWNALDYAKESRSGNEKSIKLLEDHGFQSHLMVDINRNVNDYIDRFFKDLGDITIAIIGIIIYTFPISGVIIFGLAFLIFYIYRNIKRGSKGT